MSGIGQWAAEKLKGHSHVERVNPLSEVLWEVKRKGALPTIIIAILAERHLNAVHLEPLLGSNSSVDFVVNVPKDAVISGDAYTWAESNGIPVGGFGNLLSALGDEEISAYVPGETRFLERALRQHDAVITIERLDNQRYRIHRARGNPIVAIFLNEYELTAEAVRNARDRFGGFEAIVRSNPNGGATGQAVAAAATMGATIYEFGEFLGRLNRR